MPFLPCPDMQAGSGTTDGSGDATVTFPTPFSTAPKVFLQGDDASTRGIVLDKYNVTTTGFSVKARKVTGMTGDTGAAGGHYHSIAAATTAQFVTSGTKYTAAFVTGGSDPGHTHTNPTTDWPIGNASFPTSDHVHSGTTAAPSATTSFIAIDTYSTHYCATTSGGSVTHAFKAVENVVQPVVPTSAHTHGFTTGGPDHVQSASTEEHTHTQADTGNSYTGITLYTASALTDITLNTSAAVTAIPSATGTVADHAHTVALDAVVLAVDFDWFAIEL